MTLGPLQAVAGEVRWTAHTTSRMDRMDVTVHQVAEIWSRTERTSSGFTVTQSGEVLSQVAQSAFGRVDPAQLAKLPGVPLFEIHLDKKGQVTAAKNLSKDNAASDLVAALGTQLQYHALPKVKRGASWTREQSLITQVPGPDEVPVGIQITVASEGTRTEPLEHDGASLERHALTGSVTITGNLGRRKLASKASLTGWVALNPKDPQPEVLMLHLRSIVVVGADDESPVTVWIDHRAERL